MHHPEQMTIKDFQDTSTIADVMLYGGCAALGAIALLVVLIKYGVIGSNKGEK